MAKRIFSPLSMLTLILIVFIVISILCPGVLSIFALLITLVVGSILLLIHLILAWPRLTVPRRFSIVFSILAWLGLFYGMVHANGVSIARLFN